MNKVKIATIILTVILISLVSFVGVYVQVQNRMENQVKDYKLGVNLSGYRQIVIEPTNDTQLTDADVEKTRGILENRLKDLGTQQYFIRAYKDNIVIEIAEDENTDHIVSNVFEQGKFEIVDSETKEVFINNDDIKLVNVLYGSTQSGTVVYLNIEFTKDGAEKYTDLTTRYKTLDESEENEDNTSTEGVDVTDTTDESIENGTEETKQPQITLQMDGTNVLTQSFDEPNTSGKIQLSFNGATTNSETLQENIKTAATIAAILDNGMLPVEYEVTGNSYIYSDITSEMLLIFSIVIAIIVLIALAILVIKYNVKGVVASALYIGLVALYLLIIRYTNVQLTIEGIAGILVLLVINYIITLRIIQNKNIIQEDIFPIIAVTIVFCFTKWENITSFGMVMFWGLVTLVYHMITSKLLKD